MSCKLTVEIFQDTAIDCSDLLPKGKTRVWGSRNAWKRYEGSVVLKTAIWYLELLHGILYEPFLIFFPPKTLEFFSRQVLKFKNLFLINMGCLRLHRSKTLHFHEQVKIHEMFVEIGYSMYSSDWGMLSFYPCWDFTKCIPSLLVCPVWAQSSLPWLKIFLNIFCL